MILKDEYGQEIDFTLPDTKQVSVNLSGGADSSIMFFMICHYLKSNKMTDTKVSVLTCANDLKFRWNPRRAANVINYTIDKLKWNQIDIHYTYYRDEQKKEYFHEFENDLFRHERTDLIVSGITANPKVEKALVTNIRGEEIDLLLDALPERDVFEQELVIDHLHNKRYYRPFINVDKRFVAAMYKEFGVEDLLDLTRSCEALPDIGAPYDPEFENKPCSECWWCLERKWAFGRF